MAWNATALACRRAANPVIAASMCGTMPSVQPKAATTAALGPRDRPAASVTSTPVPGDATMTNEVQEIDVHDAPAGPEASAGASCLPGAWRVRAAPVFSRSSEPGHLPTGGRAWHLRRRGAAEPTADREGTYTHGPSRFARPAALVRRGGHD